MGCVACTLLGPSLHFPLDRRLLEVFVPIGNEPWARASDYVKQTATDFARRRVSNFDQYCLSAVFESTRSYWFGSIREGGVLFVLPEEPITVASTPDAQALNPTVP